MNSRTFIVLGPLLYVGGAAQTERHRPLSIVLRTFGGLAMIYGAWKAYEKGVVG